MTLKQSIETYIYAKDGNRPYLISDAFMEDAELVMELRTNEISFPSSVRGVVGISRTLVSEFARQYENVYTFCIDKPPKDEPSFHCNWLVCMTEKSTGAARVGFGLYQWDYDTVGGKISKLQITIEEMYTLPGECSSPILAWARTLPYPWCLPDLLSRSAPAFAPVQSVVGVLKRVAGVVRVS